MKSTNRKSMFLYVLLSAAGAFGLLASTNMVPIADAQPRPSEDGCSALLEERLHAQEALVGLLGIIEVGKPGASEAAATDPLGGVSEALQSNIGAHVDCTTSQLGSPEE